ncbi:MAG TPA: hypothetical protein DD628_07280 [Clostridiales bacterium]|nr:hypothetical protein [Candidatus Apopatosoma intestinale]
MLLLLLFAFSPFFFFFFFFFFFTYSLLFFLLIIYVRPFFCLSRCRAPPRELPQKRKLPMTARRQ